MRSPGVYFNDKVDKNGKVGYGSTVIPNRGAWLELESDSKDIAYTRIDRTRKIPFTTLVRALGFSGDDEIFDIFGDRELVRNTVETDIHKNPMDSRTDEALKEIYEYLFLQYCEPIRCHQRYQRFRHRLSNQAPEPRS